VQENLVTHEIKERNKVMNKDGMTKEEFLANRKAAGQRIDPETCDIVWEYTDLADPYGVHRPPPAECIGRVMFVRSSKEDGWVLAEDLPEDKGSVLHDRIERGLPCEDDFLPF
jgi:hypothetical protein